MDLRKGDGAIYYTNGDRFMGKYLNDDKYGMGSLIYKNGTIKTGFWADDKLVDADDKIKNLKLTI